MKRAFTALALGLLVSAASAADLDKKIPAPAEDPANPAMTIRFDIAKDPRKWTQASQERVARAIITEYVPQGDSIESWKEVVSTKVSLTTVAVQAHVESWKARLGKIDPKIEIKDEANADGSITATYTSLAANESSIRRFFKGNDGIYMLTYHVRPKLKSEETFKLWQSIISSATLVSHSPLSIRPCRPAP